MTITVKILLVGDADAKKSFMHNFAKSSGAIEGDSLVADFVEKQIDIKNGKAKAIVQVNNCDVESYSELKPEILSDINLVLIVAQGTVREQLPSFVRRATQLFMGFENAPSHIFLVNSAPKNVEKLEKEFNGKVKDYNIQVATFDPETVTKIIQKEVSQAIAANNFFESTVAPKQNDLWFISRIMGALIGALLGTFTAIFVYNPIATLFAAVSQFVAKKKRFSRFVPIVVAPVWGPIKGISYKGFFKQLVRGWHKGFFKSFGAVKKLVKHAEDNEEPPISKRNIVASLLILVLIAAAAAIVIFPTIFGMAAILPAILSYLEVYFIGINTFGIWTLATITATGIFAAAALLYTLGCILSDALTWHKVNSKKGLMFVDDEPLPAKKDNISKGDGLKPLSKIIGAIVAAFLGMITAAIIYNPVAAFYIMFRESWRSAKQKGVIKALPLIFPLLLSPLWYPIVAIVKLGLYEQGKLGWAKGFNASFTAAKNIVNIKNEPDQPYVSSRDFIASLIVLGLVTAMVLSIVLPPVSLAVAPAVAAILGLSDVVGTAVLAILAGLMVFAIASIVYGTASQTRDYFSSLKTANQLDDSKDPLVKSSHQRQAGSYAATTLLSDATKRGLKMLSEKRDAAKPLTEPPASSWDSLFAWWPGTQSGQPSVPSVATDSTKSASKPGFTP